MSKQLLLKLSDDTTAGLAGLALGLSAAAPATLADRPDHIVVAPVPAPR